MTWDDPESDPLEDMRKWREIFSSPEYLEARRQEEIEWRERMQMMEEVGRLMIFGIPDDLV